MLRFCLSIRLISHDVLSLLPIKAEPEPGDFDTNALRDLAKEHQRRVRQKQADLETYELRVLDSMSELASQLSLNLNEKASKVRNLCADCRF